MSRLQRALREPQLVAYLVGCHPDRETFVDHATALIENGAGVLEVGVPFSDPVADGPTIQRAVAQALAAGIRPQDVLEACAAVRARHPDTPIVVMTYSNLAYKRGFEAFADDLRQAGVDGAILADLPPEHAGPVQAAFADDLDLVLLASPATSDERLQQLLSTTRGFLYTVGLFGVTGARDQLDPRTIELVERLRPQAQRAGVPLAVGFGVSRADHARTLVGAGADGVVVGSAFVQRVLDGAGPGETGALAAELAKGVRDGRKGR